MLCLCHLLCSGFKFGGATVVGGVAAAAAAAATVAVVFCMLSLF